MQTTFSTTFILRTAKTRDGLTPVYCRINVAGNRSEFSIKRSVTEKSWDAGKVKGNGEDAKNECCAECSLHGFDCFWFTLFF